MLGKIEMHGVMMYVGFIREGTQETQFPTKHDTGYTCSILQKNIMYAHCPWRRRQGENILSGENQEL